MTERLDQETLQGYADGALPPEQMVRVAERLLSDPAARDKVRALQADAALLRRAYQDAGEAPPPPAMLAAIDRGFARRRRRRQWQQPPALIAASLALVLLGGLAGYLAGEYRLRSEFAAQIALAQKDQQYLEAAVDQALESKASGEVLAWHNPDSGSFGEVVPVRTYRSRSNHWCREYQASTTQGGVQEKIRAVACRAGKGNWVKAEQFYYQS
jgi:surface antigen